MSSWGKSSAAARRPPPVNPNGSGGQQLRMFRRAAPYPSRGEERTEELKDVLDSYEELEQMQNFTGNAKYEAAKYEATKYEAYKHQSNAKQESCTPADRRKVLYQKFYRQVQEERKSPDCVVLSVTNQCLPSQHAQRTGHGLCCSRVQSWTRQRAPAEGPRRHCGAGLAAAG